MIKSKFVLTPHRHDTIGAMPLGHYHARAGSFFLSSGTGQNKKGRE